MLGLLFVGIMNLFISKDLINKHIGKNNYASILKASLFGIPLPLCSCGVVPTAVYMSQNRASKPAVISFLTSTPQTGIDSIIATYGMMGPIFAIYRPIAALSMGLINGVVAKFLIPEQKTKDFNIGLNVISEVNATSKKEKNDNIRKKLIEYPFIEFIDDIAPQFIAGLFIAGLISFLIPDDYFSDYLIGGGILAMIFMVLISTPMYICATASIPIAITLMMKGFSPGAAFVFLAAGPATNAASFTILSKSIGKVPTIVFISSVIVFSLLFGLLLDYIFIVLNVDIKSVLPLMSSHNHMHEFGLITILSAIVLGLTLIGSIWRIYFRKYFNKTIKSKDSQVLKIEGMTCNHCTETVSDVIRKNGLELVFNRLYK